MKYPDYKTYEAVYAKYINEENLFNMMDLAGSYKGKSFLDICCGKGAATIEATKRGTSFNCLIDQESDMLPIRLQRGTLKRYYVKESVNIALQRCNSFGSKFDIAFCRQAVNYWFNLESIKNLAKAMNKDGIFIFNTFNTCPSPQPTTKEYYLYNTKFMEISYLVKKDIIQHVQIREGHPPHLTEFRWLSEEYIKKCLDKWFKIEIIRKDKTDLYKCVRKSRQKVFYRK